ncbi:MAG TPA: carboxypeptidase regulatory-like domain-containing protein [Pyrinomonadaceae bacterium]|nr:carboxypeptidase regulatory-like domain-containing protein [Pyrinomonadaceae bacterium]
MASSSRQAIVYILLILVIVIDARSQSGTEKRPGASFNGKVTIKGKGAPGITVGLIRIEESSQQPAQHRAVTDDQGNYKITNVGPGKYWVTVAAPGLVPALGSDGNKQYLIAKSEAVENVDFALVRGGVITGKVTADGHPLIEENVSLQPVESGPGYFRHMPPPSTHTDDRGIYRIFGVPPGKYRIVAGQGRDFGSFDGGYKQTFHPNAAEASQATIIEVSEGSEATNVDITLPEVTVKYRARGRIIDGDTGQPLANVPYGVQRYLSENNTISLTTGAVSNQDGEFRFDNLPAGKYAVFVEVPPDGDFRSEYQRFEVIDQDVTGLIVKTKKGASASGVIVLEGTDDKKIHEKLRQARVYAQVSRQDSTGSSTLSSTISQDGGFRIGGLQAGIVNFGIGAQRFHIVRVERAGVALPQGIELKEREQITGLRLIVSYATGALQGVVKVDDGPVPENGLVSISLKRLGDSGSAFSMSNYSTQVDARGRFFAEGLISGTYEVTATYAPNERTHWRRTTQQVVITNGAVANVTLNVDTSAPSRP